MSAEKCLNFYSLQCLFDSKNC